MNKYIFILLSTCSSLTFGQSYAPAAGEPGSTAIEYNNPIFVGWATNVEIERGFIDISDTTVYYDGSNKATFGSPANAIGSASNITTDCVSLGDSGIAIVTFDSPIFNGSGPDFAVFENGLSNTFLELGHVEVSSDGINYVRFPSHSETQTNTPIGSFGMLEPTYLHNLAGKYKVGFGTPFDLEELKDSLALDITHISHVKIIDVVGALDGSGTMDAYGNKINDPYPTPFASGGFDLNAVGVIHQYVVGLSTEEISFNVYPNPSKGIINIDFNDKEVKSLSIYNSLGKQVEQISVLNSTETLIFELPKGVYFIHVQSADKVKSKRIVVQ
ncbi:T9SS type A sorting domain-containing protein [Brumimicrobium glaciale]|uniref:T9SS type A sorting domain-containing protein n=1 Tax=Brumimicrobium glaciale TaxID=200475 RepID=A0A4V1WGB4_9FLAO|nr:T9SS type A sorting domain-containing protein [Brumimicrobium glaciale]RYM36111.1 T9SS type A sorting domain-containing protein [Brumimicrobium glaciale]